MGWAYDMNGTCSSPRGSEISLINTNCIMENRHTKDAVTEKKSKPQEGYEMLVGVRSYEESKCIFVEVTDNGIGIGNDDIKHVMLRRQMHHTRFCVYPGYSSAIGFRIGKYDSGHEQIQRSVNCR